MFLPLLSHKRRYRIVAKALVFDFRGQLDTGKAGVTYKYDSKILPRDVVVRLEPAVALAGNDPICRRPLHSGRVILIRRYIAERISIAAHIGTSRQTVKHCY